MPFLYVVVGHQNTGGEPMFQKPPHEKNKLGVFFLLWILAASKGNSISHRIHVCYINLHLPNKWTKPRYIYIYIHMDPMGMEVEKQHIYEALTDV